MTGVSCICRRIEVHYFAGIPVGTELRIWQVEVLKREILEELDTEITIGELVETIE